MSSQQLQWVLLPCNYLLHNLLYANLVEILESESQLLSLNPKSNNNFIYNQFLCLKVGAE
jgi:hypothetical protein